MNSDIHFVLLTREDVRESFCVSSLKSAAGVTENRLVDVLCFSLPFISTYFEIPGSDPLVEGEKGGSSHNYFCQPRNFYG